MCGTIDSSQGTEWPVTCPVFGDNDGDAEWITIERMYVAFSRAKRGMVVVAPGGRETLRKIASRRMRPRYSALRYVLKYDKNFAPLKQPTPENEYRQTQLVDPQTLQKLTDPRMFAVPPFPGRADPEQEGVGPGKRRRR